MFVSSSIPIIWSTNFVMLPGVTAGSLSSRRSLAEKRQVSIIVSCGDCVSNCSTYPTQRRKDFFLRGCPFKQISPLIFPDDFLNANTSNNVVFPAPELLYRLKQQCEQTTNKKKLKKIKHSYPINAVILPAWTTPSTPFKSSKVLSLVDAFTVQPIPLNVKLTLLNGISTCNSTTSSTSSPQPRNLCQ